MSEAMKFPDKGRAWSDVEADIDQFRGSDVGFSPTNRLMTGIHIGDESIHEVCQRAYNKYFHSNAVLAELEPGLGRMQGEVLGWTVDLLNGGSTGRANMTSGGSESIFCAVHAARE
jgi:glutamate/tyrosine decarboxylase-like PLP-dependent enzyme